MTHPPTPLSKIPLPFGFARPEDSPGFLLWQTTTLWQRHLKKVLDPVDLAHPQFVLMALLLWFEGNQQIPTQILLARLSKLDKMTVSKSLRKLAAQGYVKRAEHPQDTRAKSVALTEAGKNLVSRLVPQIEAVDAAFFGKVSKKEHHILVDLLQKIALEEEPLGDPDLKLIDLYRQAEEYFFGKISSKCLEFGEGFMIYMTGLPVADLNFIYVTKRPHHFEMRLAQSEQFYDHHALSFVVIIPEEFCTHEVKNILTLQGYAQTGTSISMVLPLDKVTSDPFSQEEGGPTIRSTNDRLNEWVFPLIEAFHSPLEIGAQYARRHKSALENTANFHHFSLYRQEKPIASLTLCHQDTYARIDDVGTLPEFQGQGYATRLITYALFKAKKLGVQYCFLESSPSALRVYQKLGFKILFKNNIYSKKA